MRFKSVLMIVTTAAALEAGDRSQPAEPVVAHIGALTLRPSGFLDSIAMSRSSRTADSVSTKFGKIPLTDEPGESLASIRHSRWMLKGDLPAGPVKFSAYLESDFMNFTAHQSAHRWRQYWGQAQIGKWEVLGGQAWSLLRPNRFGTASDKDMMNTEVIEPAYHVGLVGSRTRQIRVGRALGKFKAVAAWENDGNVLTKIVRDAPGRHLELGAFTGRFGRRGVTASAGVNLTPRFRLVTQQYWSKRAAYQALGVVPAGVNGLSTLEGIEAQVTNHFQIYSYAGLVYGARADTTGNRLVREWTVGFNRKVAVPSLHSGLLMSLQYSSMDRAIWSGRSGNMQYLMYRVRYVFN